MRQVISKENLIDAAIVIVGLVLFCSCKSVEKEGLVHTPLGSFTQDEWESHESNIN
jgi:hypothetical protein|tara:strand:- start:1129 stop:1296 length:168 start_codon:yes stop_codon:yes gene_type:complete